MEPSRLAILDAQLFLPTDVPGNTMTKPTRHRITLPADSTQIDAMSSLNEINRRLDQADHAIERALSNEPTLHNRARLPNFGGAVDSAKSLLLVVSAQSTTLDDGCWQFSIEAADGSPVLEAEDRELGDLNRLTLLAAVRGLEAIDGSASVTLLSHNRYLIRSLTDSLPRWRRSDFVWDHFGRRVEVQHADLWRRIDHALGIHEVQACLLTARMVSRPKDEASDGWLRTDAAENPARSPAAPTAPHPTSAGNCDEFSFSHRKTSSPASQLSSSHRLRDWVLQSAVNAKPR